VCLVSQFAENILSLRTEQQDLETRSMKRLFVLILLFAFSIAAVAFDLKGIVIGEKSNPEAIRKALGIECLEGKDTKQYCVGESTIAEKKVTIRVQLDKLSNVAGIIVRFNPDDFRNIREALLNKYGKPYVKDASVIKNGMGVKFDQEEIVWEDKLSVVSYSKYYKITSEGAIFFMSRDKMKEMEELHRNDNSDI
jgi:hypothetical protein